MGMHPFMCAGTNVGVNAFGGRRLMVRIILAYSSTLFGEAGSLSQPRAHPYGYCSPKPTCSFTLPGLKRCFNQARSPASASSLCSLILNLRLRQQHVCIASCLCETSKYITIAGDRKEEISFRLSSISSCDNVSWWKQPRREGVCLAHNFKFAVAGRSRQRELEALSHIQF